MKVDYVDNDRADRLPHNRGDQGHVIRFLKFCPIIYLESVKLGNSNVVC